MVLSNADMIALMAVSLVSGQYLVFTKSNSIFAAKSKCSN